MSPRQHNSGVDPETFANSVRALLDEEHRRYRNFGPTWFFVKALLKRYFDRYQMPILGDFEDKTVNERIPEEVRTSLGAMIAASIEEYQENAAFNLGQSKVADDSGEFFFLLDPDVEG